jgi:hypothetical protein
MIQTGRKFRFNPLHSTTITTGNKKMLRIDVYKNK